MESYLDLLRNLLKKEVEASMVIREMDAGNGDLCIEFRAESDDEWLATLATNGEVFELWLASGFYLSQTESSELETLRDMVSIVKRQREHQFSIRQSFVGDRIEFELPSGRWIGRRWSHRWSPPRPVADS